LCCAFTTDEVVRGVAFKVAELRSEARKAAKKLRAEFKSRLQPLARRRRAQSIQQKTPLLSPDAIRPKVFGELIPNRITRTGPLVWAIKMPDTAG
jgi:hypothetical protein